MLTTVAIAVIAQAVGHRDIFVISFGMLGLAIVAGVGTDLIFNAKERLWA